MFEISEQKARSLIVSGSAGYWGIHSKTIVIEHESQTVVRLHQKWFLASFSEIGIKFIGEAGVIGDKMKGAFLVEINSQELENLAKQELAQYVDTIFRK